MTTDRDPDVLKSALAVAQLAGAAAGVVVQTPRLAYLRGRTDAHIAEVARLARDHSARQAGIDSYQNSRSSGYEDKANEILVDTKASLASIFAISQTPAKQTQG